MEFYDRKEEFTELKRIQGLSFSEHSFMTVLTGRRRIGKTSLIKRVCEGTPSVYLFVSRDREAYLVNMFVAQVRKDLGIFVPEEIRTFRSLFVLLMEAGKNMSFNLVIDEFQDFQYVNPAIFSHIQDIWDSYRKETRINLVISGSVYSMMNKLFKDKKEPLFGREDNLITLKPFQTSVLKEILHDYNASYTNEDLLALYTFTGGVPKYIELFMDNRICRKEDMISFMFRENSMFMTEGKNLLVEEFGKDYATYFSILGCMATGINTQPEIEGAMGNISIGGHLKRLKEDYAIVNKVLPFGSKEGSKGARYEISDVFLRFWFRYVHRNSSIVEIGNWPLLRKIVEDDYNVYTGDTLERYFRQRMKESMNYRQIGNWWDPKNKENQNEIDIVAISADNKSAEFYEVKRNPDKYRKQLLQSKADYCCQKIAGLKKYRIQIGNLSMEDM